MKLQAVNPPRLFLHALNLLVRHVKVGLHEQGHEEQADQAGHHDDDKPQGIKLGIKEIPVAPENTPSTQDVAPHWLDPREDDDDGQHVVDVKQDLQQDVFLVVLEGVQVQLGQAQPREGQQGAREGAEDDQQDFEGHEGNGTMRLHPLSLQELHSFSGEVAVALLQAQLQDAITHNQHTHAQHQVEKAKGEEQHLLPTLLCAQIDGSLGQQNSEAESHRQQAPEDTGIELDVVLADDVVSLCQHIHNDCAQREVHQPLVLGVVLERH